MRNLRLLRLVRLAKLMRLFSELFVMLGGIVAAMRSLVGLLVLLYIIIFVGAVIFTSLARDSEGVHEAGFTAVGDSMWLLLNHGIFMDSVSDKLNTLREVHSGYAYLFLLFMFVGNVTVLNLVVAILTDVVMKASEPVIDRSLAKEKLRLELQLTPILQCYDTDDKITKKEFHRILDDSEFQHCVSGFGIDIEDVKRFKTLFEQNHRPSRVSKNACPDSPDLALQLPDFVLQEVIVTCKEFVDMVFDLRCRSSATVNHIMQLKADLACIRKDQQELHREQLAAIRKDQQGLLQASTNLSDGGKQELE